MSFLQPFNYSSYAPFSASPFGAASRFSPYSNSPPANQLIQQTPAEQAAQFPLPQSITSESDYYGNPTVVSQQQTQSLPQQQQQSFQYQNLNQQRYNSDNLQVQGQGQGQGLGPQELPQPQQYQQPQLQQQQPQQIQKQTQPFQQQVQGNPSSPLNSIQNPNPNPSGAQSRKRRPKNSRTRSINLGNPNELRVTPIQGPIYAKDGFVPVVPLYSYNAVNNGSFYQIPILWTALSYALGLEIRGEILRGLPCIKRLNQLFCPTAGTTYPLERIERFIDENKALTKRMYGEFSMTPDSFGGSSTSGGNNNGNTLRRSAREVYEDEVPDYFEAQHSKKNNKRHTRSTSNQFGNVTDSDSDSHVRTSRQTVNPRNGGPMQQPKSNRVDSCESTVEIVTPYWAANSSGKVRAIVNTQHFEQAIHQEVCAKTSTKRCSGDCACEQKYKWHRLLAYEPDNDCRGIFMDWFLFPSCCVCRCNPTT